METEKIDALFFIGPQGSGKGTQASKLAEKLDFFYWENGAIVREEAKKDTPLGRQVADLINAGIYLPDELMFEIFHSRMHVIPSDHGVIFDGIPRRLAQADYIFDVLKKQGRDNLVTIFIDVPREESVARLMRRSGIEHRADDTPEKIGLRLDQYEHDTVPVLDYMKNATKYYAIDGKPTIEEVTASINKALGV